MFRDRTNLYVSFRQSYAHHPQYISTASSGGAFDSSSVPEEQQGLIGGAAGMGDDQTISIEMDVLPPAWLDISDSVEERLAQIDTKTTRLAALHRKNALPGFDDRTEEEELIERLTYEITNELHACQTGIKKFERVAQGGSSTSEELRMSKNMKMALAVKVQTASTRFRKMQSNYLRSLRNEAFSQPNANNDNLLLLGEGGDGENTSLDADNDAALSHKTLEAQQANPQLIQTGAPNEQTILHREKEITKIAQGILELSEIFKDLQAMVIDQGTLLDRIDYNIETMHSNVKAADKDLVQATHYQKRTQKCKIILLLSLLVFGLFIILLIKPKRHHEYYPPPAAETTTTTTTTSPPTATPTPPEEARPTKPDTHLLLY